ncbi:MAG TPA: glycosyltransferase family 39 protein, partial [Chitinophagaceae bacterium]|nr:glycosyltransferase family 39 protein [Chitinophagaceae bacterium]
QILKGSTDRSTDIRFRSTMPVSALNALPRAFEQVFHRDRKKTDGGEADIKNGRYITILFSLGLLFYCFRFAAELCSPVAGCFVMAFVAFDPNVIAHSRLVTTDLFAALSFIATIYHLWRWLDKGHQPHFYYWCLAIAIAQCCKPNSIILYLICAVPILFHLLQNGSRLRPVPIFKRAAFFLAAQLFIINAAFLFQGPWGETLGQHHFHSAFFQSLQKGALSKIPIPFVNAYVETFDLVQYELETFDGTALNYLLGALRYKSGFWNYYLVCFFFKTPVLTLFAIAAGTLRWLIAGKYRTFLLYGAWPAAFVFLLLSNAAIQSGYRYLIPVSCLMTVFAAPVMDYLWQKSKLVAFIVLLLPLVESVSVFPDYISYTNYFVPNKKLAYRLFADSNLQWGQRITALKAFMAAHPGYLLEPAVPTTGMIIVDVNQLVGIQQPGKFAWLRRSYLPVGTIGGCYLIFNVTATNTDFPQKMLQKQQ